MSIAKLGVLREILSGMDAVIVAYSGGADSAFLADAAHEALGERALMVTAVSPSLAPSERDAAAALAAERGWNHLEIRTDEMDDPRYRANDARRCFFCKDTLFRALAPLAAQRGSQVLVGTNTDDLGDHRPGQAAAHEHGVRAPLVEAGLSKDELRTLSRDRGLPTWDKPASACLSSRIAYGVEVTPERLDRVARAEALLRDLGMAQVRVRDHGDLARLEVEPGDIERIAAPGVRERIAAELKDLGFAFVTLDLEGFRSGSMNALLSIGRARH